MKKWVSLLLVTGMLLGLAACGQKNDVPQADPPAVVGGEEPDIPPSDAEGEEPGIPPSDTEGEEPALPPQTQEEGEDGRQEEEEPWRAMVSHEDVTLFSAGETFRLTVWDLNGNAPDACTYTSADPAVAAVDETGGEVTAVGPGTTTVTVLAEYGGDEVSFPCIVRCSWKEEEPVLPEDAGGDAFPALEDFFAALQDSYEGLGAMMVIDGELLDNYYPGLSGIAAVEEVLIQETMMSVANAAVGLVKLSDDATFDDVAAVSDALNARITAQADGGAWYPASCETWGQGVVTSVSGYVGMFVYPEEAQAMADLFTRTYSN